MLMFLLPLCILMFNDFTVNAQALMQNNASKSCVCCFLFLYKAFYVSIFLLFCTEINYLIASSIGKLVAMMPNSYNTF